MAFTVVWIGGKNHKAEFSSEIYRYLSVASLEAGELPCLLLTPAAAAVPMETILLLKGTGYLARSSPSTQNMCQTESGT